MTQSVFKSAFTSLEFQAKFFSSKHCQCDVKYVAHSMQVVKGVKTHWNVVIFQVKQVVPANKSDQLVYEEVVFELSDDRNNGNVTISVPSGTIQNVAKSFTGNAPVIYAVVVGKLRFNNKSRTQPQTRSQVSFCQLYHAGMSGCKQVFINDFYTGKHRSIRNRRTFYANF